MRRASAPPTVRALIGGGGRIRSVESTTHSVPRPALSDVAQRRRDNPDPYVVTWGDEYSLTSRKVARTFRCESRPTGRRGPSPWVFSLCSRPGHGRAGRGRLQSLCAMGSGSCTSPLGTLAVGVNASAPVPQPPRMGSSSPPRSRWSASP